MAEARFVCLCCGMLFPVLLKHVCQKECRGSAGVHVDFCTDCQRALLDKWSAQLQT
jgi:hypothetical protein